MIPSFVHIVYQATETMHQGSVVPSTFTYGTEIHLHLSSMRHHHNMCGRSHTPMLIVRLRCMYAACMLSYMSQQLFVVIPVGSHACTAPHDRIIARLHATMHNNIASEQDSTERAWPDLLQA